jgi:peptide/nickel transport system substrate-binding protein
VTIRFKVKQETVDNNLLSDNITVDGAGTGVAPATQPKVLTKADLKKQTDNSYAGATSYIGLNVNVAPFDNIHCRKAVQWGIDKASVQAAQGGDPKGDVATTLLPPTVNGYSKFDLYESAGHKGDEAKAKDELKQCGKPNGFDTKISARSDRPAEMAMVTAVQASLKKIGVNAEIKTFPAGKYFQNFAGNPSYVHANKLGMIMSAWGADWPTGFGFLDQIINGSAIKPSGGNNVQELNDPKINKMLNDGIATTDDVARAKAWGDIDKAVAEGATAVPLIYRKNLLLRPESATNVTVTQAYLGMYDYVLMGSAK